MCGYSVVYGTIRLGGERMNYMLVFLLACAGIGLFSPVRAKRGALILGLTVALVLFFMLSPHRL